jgi:hypothetical protein
MHAAISPDTLRDRQACLAGPFKRPMLTRATMALALGPFPVDNQAKAQAGQAVLYVTNGFKCAQLASMRLFLSAQRRHGRSGVIYAVIAGSIGTHTGVACM